MMRACIFLLAASYSLLASGEEGDLAGLIQDMTGGAICSAKVTATNEETGIRHNATSDCEGAYFLPALREGRYKVIVRRPGFQTIARWNVVVRRASTGRLDFVMQVGSMRQVVTIETGTAPLNVNDGSVGTLVNRETALSLPTNGRGLLTLVELSPGVVSTPATGGEAGQFSSNGLRSNTNYFTVDGVTANTGVTGAGLPAQFSAAALPAMTAFGSTQNLVSPESLEEVRVLTSSFAPEFGRLPGAQVAVTTRSGTNQYHGAFWYSLRNEGLDANDWFANSRSQEQPSLRLNHWNATLGGPLKRDRTFFFGSYEGLRLIQPFSAVLITPSAESRLQAPAALRPVLEAFPEPQGAALSPGVSQHAAVVSHPARLDQESLRIDHALTERVNLFGRYNRAPSFARSGFNQLEDFHLNSTSLTLGASVIGGPAVTNEARLNLWNTAAQSTWAASPLGGGLPLNLSEILKVPGVSNATFYGLAIGGVGALYSGSASRNRQRQFNLVDTLALNRNQHEVRVGIDYQRLMPTRDTPSVSVTGTWNNLDELLSGTNPILTTLRAEPTSALIETLSAFLQDTWRLWPRLTLTYGLRWELTPPPAMRGPGNAQAAEHVRAAPALNNPYLSIVPPTEPLWQTRYTQFAPRIGAAYRIGDSSVVRGGFGAFYDVQFSAALDPINGFPFNRWQFGSGQQPATFDGAAAAFGTHAAPDLKLPYALEWNVAYERMFTVRDVASVSYVGSSGRNLLRYEGTLQPGTRLAQLAVATNHGKSSYHGLQLQYRRRLARGIHGIASYTWSHSIDNGSWDSGLYLVEGAISAQSDRANSSFDVRHSVTAGLSYMLPPKQGGALGALTHGWELSGMLRARSGFPIDLLTTQNFLGLGFDNISHPDRVPGVPIWIPDEVLGGRKLNAEAFRFPSSLQGNLGRNSISGFGMTQLDLALKRVFPVRDDASLELRLEAYNALNHPNAADPVRFLDHPYFGSPVSMLNLMLGSGNARSGLAPAFQIGGPRSLQLTFVLRF